MIISDTYNKILLNEGAESALSFLIESQDVPAHIRALIRAAYRFIDCKHTVVAGYSVIGPSMKRVFPSKDGDVIIETGHNRVRMNKNTYTVQKDKTKIGTHSGFYGYYHKQCVEKIDYYGNCKKDKVYYGWDINSNYFPPIPNEMVKPDIKWTMKEFSRAAIWLMEKPYEQMRKLNFQFNSLFLYTDNMCVLDMDLYKSKLPAATLKWIISKIPAGTPCTISQAGGRHFFFKPTPGLKGKPELGIDLLQGHGFVFAPPTRVSGGGEYTFANGLTPDHFPEVLPDVPDSIRGFFSTLKPVKQVNGNINKTKSVFRSGSFSKKQLDVLEQHFKNAEANIGNDDGGRSVRDYAAIHWSQNIGMDFETFWSYAENRSKFAERGLPYAEAIWNKLSGQHQ